MNGEGRNNKQDTFLLRTFIFVSSLQPAHPFLNHYAAAQDFHSPESTFLYKYSIWMQRLEPFKDTFEED